MKISILYPEIGVHNGKNWLWWVVQELKKTHEIIENNCDESCDVIICMSVSQTMNLSDIHRKYPKIPMITYNWDWFPFIKKNPNYTDLMNKSVEVWSASKDTANISPFKSIPLYGCIIPEEWGETKDEGYAIMASRNDWYKRFDWFEKACEELKIPYKSYHPESNTRQDYVQAMSNSSIVVSPSLYEGFGLTPFEGAYLGKPLVLADTNIFKELWNERAYFFKSDSYSDFKEVLVKAWKEKGLTNNKKYVEDNFLPQNMANKINERLICLKYL